MTFWRGVALGRGPEHGDEHSFISPQLQGFRLYLRLDIGVAKRLGAQQPTIDRIVMLFGGLDNIRDCIAFPKTQRASDLMTGAPGPVEAKQLKELGIKLNV
jgi:aspartyl-tRNA synthetase